MFGHNLSRPVFPNGLADDRICKEYEGDRQTDHRNGTFEDGTELSIGRYQAGPKVPFDQWSQNETEDNRSQIDIQLLEYVTEKTENHQDPHVKDPIVQREDTDDTKYDQRGEQQ